MQDTTNPSQTGDSNNIIDSTGLPNTINMTESPLPTLAPLSEEDFLKATNDIPVKTATGMENTGSKNLIYFGWVVLILVLFVIILIALKNLTGKTNNANVSPTPTIEPTISITENVELTIIPTLKIINNITLTPVIITPMLDSSRLQITSPTNNSYVTITSPGSGTISFNGKMQGFFEGTMNYRVIDASGKVLTKDVVNASADNYGTFVSFEKIITISYVTAILNPGRLEVYDVSMKDGAETVLAVIPLQF